MKKYEFNTLFQVRVATYEDIPDIMSITREAFIKYRELAGVENTPALDETYRDRENDLGSKIVLIAFSNGDPVGSVRLEIDKENKTAYLSRFGVKITSQNNGIGKSIMNIVDKIMIDQGVKKLSLHTASKITSLIRFYYGRGFYIDSTDKSKGYIRALLVKDYE
jgi:ribosomal protein S18 acetylase RimI-like enzyme